MFIFIHLLTKSHFANYDIRDTTTDERQTSLLPLGVLSTRRTADNWAGGEEDGIENPAR